MSIIYHFIPIYINWQTARSWFRLWFMTWDCGFLLNKKLCVWVYVYVYVPSRKHMHACVHAFVHILVTNCDLFWCPNKSRSKLFSWPTLTRKDRKNLWMVSVELGLKCKPPSIKVLKVIKVVLHTKLSPILTPFSMSIFQSINMLIHTLYQFCQVWEMVSVCI